MFSQCECNLSFFFFFIHRNGDGFIDREEFGDILHLTGENVTEDDIDEMFGDSDTNKDGKIDFDGKIREELITSCGLRASSIMLMLGVDKKIKTALKSDLLRNWSQLVWLLLFSHDEYLL